MGRPRKQMGRYVGIEVHKETAVSCMIDEPGIVLQRHRWSCTREALAQLSRRSLQATDKVALEATTNTWAVVESLKPLVAEVVVSKPLQTTASAAAKSKTDTVEAEVWAHLLRCDFLPRVWEPPVATQALRRVTARRAALVMDKTAIKTRLHAVLHHRLIPCPFSDLCGVQGRHWLQTLALDTEGRTIVDSDLRLLASIEAEIAQHEQEVATAAYEEPTVKLLLTLPGVSLPVAQTVWAV